MNSMSWISTDNRNFEKWVGLDTPGPSSSAAPEYYRALKHPWHEAAPALMNSQIKSFLLKVSRDWDRNIVTVFSQP